MGGGDCSAGVVGGGSDYAVVVGIVGGITVLELWVVVIVVLELVLLVVVLKCWCFINNICVLVNGCPVNAGVVLRMCVCWLL